MPQVCSKCSRVNPQDASYCYYDGNLLDGHAHNGGAVRSGSQPFPSPFIFPSGLVCRNFDQLALTSQDHWPEAVELLQQGYLETFFGGLGRADLAFGAREAARFPDRDRGLDQLLAKLPTNVLEPPKLHVEPRDLNLGLLQVGDNRQFELHLTNHGSRLLYGTVTCDDCKWLALGDAPGTAQKVFQFGGEMTIPVQVRGAHLRAGTKPLEGRLLVESNGGTTTVTVRCEVPVKPFPEGVLAGARSPRQIAEKAKAAPKEAAVLFERGAVADWYKANGWIYPVQGPSSSGLGAVQQFFEALGLTAPPKVDINQRALSFSGQVGASLRQNLEVKAQEKRPVFAHGTSDQPWLVVQKAQLNGRTAIIPVTIPAVPNRSGEVLQGKVTITSNGNQRFVVPVTLHVTGGGYAQPIILMEEEVPVLANLVPEPAPVAAGPPPGFAVPVVPLATAVPAAPAAPAAPVVQLATGRPPSHPELAPAPVVLAEPAPGFPSRRPREPRTSVWVHLLPALVLGVGLLGMVIHDLFVRAPRDQDYPVFPEPQVATLFMQGRFEHQDKGIEQAVNENLGDSSLRFGIVMPNADDPNGKTLENPTGKKRLTFSPTGVSNNTCAKIDGAEALLGTNRPGWPQGKWVKDTKELGTADDGPPGRRERQRHGRVSVWRYNESKVEITQTVEVIPNQQPADVDYEGKKQEMRQLDTVLVKYEIANKDNVAHKVGLRFMLDTFIGSNDGVPFTIPGVDGLCDTQAEFTRDIPDYIEALENPDLANPGTVAHLTLRLPGLEVPERVTLGVWPANELRDRDPKARSYMTMWEVPYLSMKDRNPPDSAVTMYWGEQDLGPGKARVVGFAYGLGNFTGSGKIGISMDGDFSVGGTFTVTALVSDPKAGEKATIELPAGLALAEGETAQKEIPAPGGNSKNSPVTWKVTAQDKGRKTIKVTVPGASQVKPVSIKVRRGIF